MDEFILSVKFYATENGNEPVREWLKSLPEQGKYKPKKDIGADIKTVQVGWPIGMPKVRKLKNTTNLWEVRTTIKNGIARVIFFMISNQTMFLLHGFIKKLKKLLNKILILRLRD